jgi:hypothetical protein
MTSGSEVLVWDTHTDRHTGRQTDRERERDRQTSDLISLL